MFCMAMKSGVISSGGKSGFQEFRFEFRNPSSIYVSCRELYLFDENNNIVPLNMTSNSTPYPLLASASSTWSSSHPVFEMFNNDHLSILDYWHSKSQSTYEWVQLKLASKINLTKIRYYIRSTSQIPSLIDIKARNDSDSFQILKQTNDSDKVWNRSTYFDLLL